MCNSFKTTARSNPFNFQCIRTFPDRRDQFLLYHWQIIELMKQVLS